MIKTLMASAAATALMLSFSGSAMADCSEEIAAFKSQEFTGSVDTSAKTGAEGQPDGQIGGESHAAADTTAAPMQEGDTPVAGEVPQTEATAAMNEAVGDRAASAEDVRKQDAGEPTAAQQAQEADEAPQGDTETATAESENAADQFAVLMQRAEQYQKLGNEEACMNVIEEARALTQ